MSIAASVVEAPAVQAGAIGYAYAGRRALEGVTFSVGRGEIFGLLGPNGSGKSTIFRLLSTLARPQQGALEVLGRDPVRERSALRRRLGVVFQSPALDLQLTVDENLRVAGWVAGLRGGALAARIAELGDRLGVAERRHERAATLSGGLRRRVELARALLAGPELLLLDEPSTGLDPTVRRLLLGELQRLCREDGVTVVLSTHLLDEAERCDRLLLLDRGRVVACGAPAALIAEVGGEVLRLEGEDPGAIADRVQAALGGAAGRVEVVDGGVRCEVPDAATAVPALLSQLGGAVRSLSVSRPTLADVFERRTGHRWTEDGR